MSDQLVFDSMPPPPAGVADPAANAAAPAADVPQNYPKGFTPTPDSNSPLYHLSIEKVFDGPLDLLLYLIKKHDVDILDIPISFITSKYLAHLELMQNLNIDVAAGFLTLAAELTFIKSKMLVPQLETGEEQADDELELDPRGELVRRLLEYQKYKDAGSRLGERDVLGRDQFARSFVPQADVYDTDGALAEVPMFKLIEALDQLLAKGKLEVKHHVVVENLSLADKLQLIIERLKREQQFEFTSLFADLSTKREIIFTFLALLEVTKLKLVRIHQIDMDGEIYIRAVAEKLAQFDASASGLYEQTGQGPLDEYR